MRENESLRDQLTTQRQAHKKCEADYAAALQQIDELKRQLTERGVNLENMSASLAEQRKALEEYARRTEQLDADPQALRAAAAEAPEAHAARSCRSRCATTA